MSYVKENDYIFDDDSSGLSTACEMARDAMVAAGAPVSKSQWVLTSILAEWPVLYVEGGRRKELAALVNRLVKSSLILVVLVLLTTLSGVESAAVPTEGPAHRGYPYSTVEQLISFTTPGLKSSAMDETTHNSGEGMPSTDSPRFRPAETDEDVNDNKIGHKYGGMYGRVPPGMPRGAGNLHIAETVKEAAEAVAAIAKDETEKVIGSVTHVTDAVQQAYDAVESYAHEFTQVIEHPVNSLLKTRTGTVVLILIILAVVVVFIRVTGPAIRMSFNFVCIISRFTYSSIRFVMSPIYSIIRQSACCMNCCALYPLVKVRNWRKAKQIEERDRKRIKIYNAGEMEEMIQVLKRTHSKLRTDEHGVYLDAGENHRVYLDPNTQAEDLLTLRMLPNPARESGSGVTIKETILTGSKLYKVDKIPDFQGQFDVDGTIVGHFARIKYNDKDCLITAFHVLDYNRSALISLRKGDKLVRLDSVRTRIICASRTEELDFLIMELPSFVFSTLGLKTGTWTPRVQAREPISIYQFYEGKPCVSSASIRLSDVKPWHVNYSASTLPGTSGAPILDTRNNIIGVHVEHDVQAKCNVGVIPPVFRNSRKESPTNEDILQGMMELAAYELPEDDETEEERTEREEREEREELYRVLFSRDIEDLKQKGQQMSWGEQMDYIEEHISSRMKDEYAVMWTKAGKSGRHVNQMVKRGVIRKESPWTCSKCNCIHIKRAYNCTNCGFALVKLTKQRLEARKQGATTATSILRDKVPEEVVQKIIGSVDQHNLAGEIARQVCQMISTWPSEVPKLPEYATVLMDKHDAQKLATAPSAPSWLPSYPIGVREGNLTVQQTVHDPTHEEPGSVCLKTIFKPIAKIQTIKKNKETQEVPQTNEEVDKIAPLSKSARRRLRVRERAAVSASQVPLNSKSPVKTGVPTTNGAQKKNSPERVSKSGTPSAPSKEGNKGKSQKNGEHSVLSTAGTKSTPGPQEAQKQKRPVLSSK